MTLRFSERPWRLRESRVTEESVYLDRRRFLRASSSLCAAAALGLLGCRSISDRPHQKSALVPDDDGVGNNPGPDAGPLELGIPKFEMPYPHVPRNPPWSTVPEGRVLAEHVTAASYNNFYEFTTAKKSVYKRVSKFRTRPWQVEVAGLVHKPMTLDIDDILRRFAHEERIYRLRCVEAWAMVVPWSGFPLRALLDAVEPLGTAKYVRFVTANLPEQMPGLKNTSWYPWPYHEALRIDEAAHELTFMATGLYGKHLPLQNGAPLRLVVPWKYGYKSIKSIVRIEVTAEQPPTFWHSLEPAEYSFLSNVDPTVPHPRWSQAEERDIQTGERHQTLPFNGYGEWVASLYAK